MSFQSVPAMPEVGAGELLLIGTGLFAPILAVLLTVPGRPIPD
jgi:hypothetical protein